MTTRIPEALIDKLSNAISKNFARASGDREPLTRFEHVHGDADLKAYEWWYWLGDNAASMAILAGWLEAQEARYSVFWDMAGEHGGEWMIATDRRIGAANDREEAAS
jgi:hypothetical protein